MLGWPKTQDGLQKAVPERSVDSERQKSESIKTSKNKQKNPHKSEEINKNTQIYTSRSDTCY